jgi:hypothetical protein
MWAFLRGEPAVVTRLAIPLFLSAIVGALLLAKLGNVFPGIIAVMYAGWLGGSGVLLLRWRTEPGLWMLAALLLVAGCVIYGMIVAGQVVEAIRGIARPGLGLTVDAALGTLLLSVHLRFLIRVIHQNRKISRTRDDA